MELSTLDIAGILGILGVVYVLGREVWNLFYTSYLGHALGRTIDLKTIGSWAVVTGATDGIGRGYAEELACLGLNIVLISRSPYKLQNAAGEIESAYKVKTRIIDVDFTKGPEIYERIAKEIEGLEVGVLVNNVGMSYNYPEYLAEVPNGVDFAQNLINCNVVAVTKMSMMVLPQMVQRRKGLILNISSASAVLPTPLMTMYSSTKAFVLKFSEDLNLEYKPFGITVQCVLPGFVATNMSRIRRPTLRVPLPKDFVRSQIKSLGLEVASAGYWVHKIQLRYYQYLNVICAPLVIRVTWNNLNGTRLRVLKKLQLHKEQQQQEQQGQGQENPKDK